MNWRPYTGSYTQKFRQRGKPWVHNIQMTHPVPTDLIRNVVHVADHVPELDFLYSYLDTDGACVSIDDIVIPHEYKRLVGNPDGQLPTVIFEKSRLASPVRIGFACRNVRPDDLVCQFVGLDVTLIARRVGGGLRLVGKALMVTHNKLQQPLPRHPICKASPLLSHCLNHENPARLGFKTDPVSFVEIMSGPPPKDDPLPADEVAVEPPATSDSRRAPRRGVFARLPWRGKGV